MHVSDDLPLDHDIVAISGQNSQKDGTLGFLLQYIPSVLARMKNKTVGSRRSLIPDLVSSPY